MLKRIQSSWGCNIWIWWEMWVKIDLVILESFLFFCCGKWDSTLLHAFRFLIVSVGHWICALPWKCAGVTLAMVAPLFPRLGASSLHALPSVHLTSSPSTPGRGTRRWCSAISSSPPLQLFCLVIDIVHFVYNLHFFFFLSFFQLHRLVFSFQGRQVFIYSTFNNNMYYMMWCLSVIL